MSFTYLTVEEVIAMNQDIMAAEKRQSIILNSGLLESGLMRVQQVAFYIAEADFITQAAYVMAGIAMAHGFADGNKRTAFAAFTTFLVINGSELEADPLDAGRAIETFVKSAELDEDALTTAQATQCKTQYWLSRVVTEVAHTEHYSIVTVTPVMRQVVNGAVISS